jgi:hypothetical protein
MKPFLRRGLFAASTLTLFAWSAFAQFGATSSTTLAVTVGAEGAISVTTGSTALAAAGTNFANPFTGTTSFLFKMRTTKTGGTGTLTLKVTTDFPATGGPSVGAAINGDTLTYTCTAASGTPCATVQTASTTSQTSVATWGADAHSAASGDAGTVVWSLTNDPAYKTGVYNATVTFTISAT